MQNHNNDKIDTLNQQVAAGEAKEKERNDQNKLVLKLQQELTSANNRLNEIKEIIGKHQAHIQSSDRIIETKRNELAGHQSEVEKHVNAGDWENDWKTEPRQFAAELKRRQSCLGGLSRTNNSRSPLLIMP